jgi:tetratricopeptide (TPR) repeat protein
MLAFVHAGDDIAMAARYTYLPAIAPGIAVAAALVLFTGKLLAQGRRLFAVALLGTVAVFLAISVGITLKLVNVWKDTGSFWSRVIEIEPVGRAYGDRGVYYLINGKSAAAANDFSAAIDIAVKAGIRSIYNLYAFRGVALGDTGRFVEAVADFDRAIELYPHPTYFQQRGIALKALGRAAEAEEDFRRAGRNPPPIDWFE